MEPTRKDPEGAQAQLGLWDVTSIIVGIIIGVGIFETPHEIFQIVPSPAAALGTWGLGGILALVGALCFAELASTYPRSGGEYVYLTRAFGPQVGFLFAWAQLAVIRPAGIAALAYVFANWGRAFLPLPPLVLALTAVAVLTLVNVGGVTFGTATQNLLTIGKLVGLVGIVVVGLFLSPLHLPTAEPVTAKSGWFASAMIMVLWTYAGWHEAAYIAAEVKDSQRNLPLSLVLGTLIVTAVYLLVNGAILLALGFEAAQTKSPVEIFRGGLGRTINLVIMVSALGALNGMIFTTARIFSAFGTDHRLFAPLGHWSRRLGTPARALMIQGLLGIVYLLLGLASEVFKLAWFDDKSFAEILRRFTAEESLGLQNLEYWIKLTAAVFWSFFLLTGVALFVLRARDPDTPRPFRVPLYPLLPVVFCGWCGYMVYGAVATSPHEALFGFLVLLAGLPLYYLPQKRRRGEVSEESKPLVGAGKTV